MPETQIGGLFFLSSVRENLPIIVVVFEDEEIGLIRVKQEIKGILRFGVGLGGLSWTALAEGFGADDVVVETRHQLGDTLQAAVEAAAPRWSRSASTVEPMWINSTR